MAERAGPNGLRFQREITLGNVVTMISLLIAVGGYAVYQENRLTHLEAAQRQNTEAIAAGILPSATAQLAAMNKDINHLSAEVRELKTTMRRLESILFKIYGTPGQGQIIK